MVFAQPKRLSLVIPGAWEVRQGASGLVHVDPETEPGTRPRLLAGVEPLEPGSHGVEVAAAALYALREAFASNDHLPSAVALGRAFAAADSAVRALNRLRPPLGRTRRILVGATAVALDRGEMTVAQVPPGQVLVVQDGRLYGIPDLAAWRLEGAGDDSDAAAEPLGRGGTVAPRFFRAEVGCDDLVLLCPTAVGRLLTDPTLLAGFAAEDGGDAVESGGPPSGPSAPWGLRGGADRARWWLEPLAAEIGVSPVLIPCVEVGRLAAKRPRATAWRAAKSPAGAMVAGGGMSTVRPMAAAVGKVPAATPAETRSSGAFRPTQAEPEPAVPPLGAASRSFGTYLPTSGMVPLRPGVDVEEPLPRGLLDPAPPASGPEPIAPLGEFSPRFLGSGDDCCDEGRSLTATAGGGERDEPSSEVAWSPPSPERLSLGRLPGALGMGRHRSALIGPLPADWRGRLPRSPRLVPPRPVMLAVLALLLVGSAVGVARERRAVTTERAEQAASALAELDAQLMLAGRAVGGATEDPLRRAEAALDEAVANGAPAEDVASRRATFEDLRDRSRGVVRLPAVRLGSVPGVSDVAGGAGSRLLVDEEAVYLLGSGGLFRLDPRGGEPERLLGSDQTVAGRAVGVLRAGAAASGGVVVTDGLALFALDAAGVWRSRPLEGWPATGAGPCALFAASLYCLDTDAGRILKAPGLEEDGSGPVSVQTWNGADAREELKDAVDLVVDGEIRILLGDGRVRSFSRGVAVSETTAGVLPPIGEPTAMDGGADSGALYVADRGDGRGRILRHDLDGRVSEQFVLLVHQSEADAAATLVGEVKDLAVDEATGVVYLVAGDAVWRAELPG